MANYSNLNEIVKLARIVRELEYYVPRIEAAVDKDDIGFIVTITGDYNNTVSDSEDEDSTVSSSSDEESEEKSVELTPFKLILDRSEEKQAIANMFRVRLNEARTAYDSK